MDQRLRYYTNAMAIDPETNKVMPKTAVQLTGSYVRLSTEPKPTATDGVQDGNDLFLVDTGQAFIFYKGEWREI